MLAQLDALSESFRREDTRLTGALRVAAPFGYGRHHVAPALLQHRCVCIRENDEDVTLWRFHRRAKSSASSASSTRRASTRNSVRVAPAYTSNDGSVAREWAEQGLGLVLRSEWDTRESVASGKFVRVLADWAFDSAPVILLVPTRRGPTARLQALIAFLEDALGAPAARVSLPPSGESMGAFGTSGPRAVRQHTASKE